MARGEAANPFDPQARTIKSISQKRNKTDDDYEELARLQFKSSLYYDPEIGPYLPVDNLLKCLQEGASKYKEGPKIKAQATIIGLVGKEEDPAAAALIYNGPRDLDSLYPQFAFKKMGRLGTGTKKVSVLTSRAKFNKWIVECIVESYDLEQDRLLDYWTIAGRIVGIGTWRPRHGLFDVEVI
jgi:hypothetical protein